MLNSQLIANPADYEIGRVFQGTWPGIKGRHSWEDDGSCLRTDGKIAELNSIQRRLSGNQHEAAALFEMYIRSPMNQVLG